MSINQIQKRLGIILFNASIRYLRASFKTLNPRKVSYGDLTNIVRLGFPNIPTRQHDMWFYLTDWKNWEEFSNIFQEKIKYYSEKFDCDNYAYLVSSFASLVMLLNSCGVVHCKVYNKKTGKMLGGHFCNLIVTKHNELYLYDLNNGGGSVMYRAGKETIIGNWIYKDIDRVHFF